MTAKDDKHLKYVVDGKRIISEKVLNGSVPWTVADDAELEEEQRLEQDDTINNPTVHPPNQTPTDKDDAYLFGIGKTYYNTKQAFASADGDKFKMSNRAEVDQLKGGGVITPVKIDSGGVKTYLDSGRNVMKSIKFHLLKYKEDGSIKAKSRWCLPTQPGQLPATIQRHARPRP